MAWRKIGAHPFGELKDIRANRRIVICGISNRGLLPGVRRAGVSRIVSEEASEADDQNRRRRRGKPFRKTQHAALFGHFSRTMKTRKGGLRKSRNRCPSQISAQPAKSIQFGGANAATRQVRPKRSTIGSAHFAVVVRLNMFRL